MTMTIEVEKQITVQPQPIADENPYLWLMALDQATRETGYCTFKLERRDGEIINYEFNVQSMVKADGLMSMAWTLRDYVRNVDMIVCEDNKHQRNARTAQVLAELLGALRMICGYEGTTFLDPISPREIAIAAHVDPFTKRAPRLKILAERAELETSQKFNEHTCVAYWLGRCAIEKLMKGENK